MEPGKRPYTIQRNIRIFAQLISEIIHRLYKLWHLGEYEGQREKLKIKVKATERIIYKPMEFGTIYERQSRTKDLSNEVNKLNRKHCCPHVYIYMKQVLYQHLHVVSTALRRIQVSMLYYISCNQYTVVALTDVQSVSIVCKLTW